MPTNKEAKDQLFDAYAKLLMTYSTAPSSEKANITKSRKAISAEYLRLAGRPDLINAGYDVLKGELAAAAAAITRVKERRDQIANAFVKATELLASLNKVLALIG